MTRCLLVLAIGCSVVYSQESYHSQNIKDNNTGQPHPNDKAKTLQEEPEYRAIPVNPHPRPQQNQSSTARRDEYSRANSSEHPPFSTAISNWCTVYGSIIQLVVGLLTLFVLIGTLVSTRRAAKASVVSSRATAHLAASEQACMTVDGIQDTHQNDGFYLTAYWTNYGRTPAILRTYCIDFGTPDPKTAWPCFNPTPHSTNGTKVGPQQRFPCPTEMIKPDVRDSVIKGNTGAYLYTRIEYTDGFTDDTKTEEAILKITRQTNWDGYGDMIKRNGVTKVTGCFKWEIVAYRLFITPKNT